MPVREVCSYPKHCQALFDTPCRRYPLHSPLGRRGEANVGGHKLVGMNIGVDFDADLLFLGFQMPTDTFENEIGEERNGRRIDDLQAFDPLWTPAPPAVRRWLRRCIRCGTGWHQRVWNGMALMPQWPNLWFIRHLE